MDHLGEVNEVDIDISKHRRLVHHVFNITRIKPYGIFDEDDYIQAGLIGLWIAAKKFDPSRGFTFATHAVPWIRSEMYKLKNYENAKKRTAKTVSIYKEIGYIDGYPLLLLDVIPADEIVEESSLENIELKDRINKAMKYEPFIVECLIKGEKPPQISKKMGITQQRVHQRIKAMRKKLAKRMPKIQ